MRFVIPRGKYRKLTRILTHLDCEFAVCGSILGKLFRAGFLEESEYEKLRDNSLLDECGAYEEMAIEEQVSKDIKWKGKPVKFYYDEGAGPMRY